MNQPFPRPVASPLVHGLAVITVVCAMPLLFLGAEVTTKGVGMVDSEGLRSPWFFMTEFMKDHGMGWLIEHGHRQVGWIVGVCAILLAGAACLFDRRRWVKVLSVFALLAVTTQGLLGIFRIQLNAILGKTLALIHGSFAQIVFALLVTIAVGTSQGWGVGAIEVDKSKRLRRLAVIATVTLFGQLILGGLIRHKDLLVAGRLHLLGAFVVFGLLYALIKVAVETDRDSFQRLTRVLMALLTVQILLGAEAWMAWMKRYFVPNLAIEESTAMQLTRSAHYLVGAFLFATTVTLTVKALWAPSRTEAAL